MIRIERASRSFAARDGRAPVHALRELDLEVGRGECVCLIGPSGCGKTTTLRLINRLLEASSGRILVEGTDVTQLDPVALRRRMGYVIQSGGLFPHMTVAQNVGLLCRIEDWEPERIERRVRALLSRVHLAADDFATRYPAQLSGGQRQRVSVARALALDPPILLMDEPFGALDPITRRGLQAEFLELKEELGKTLVLVTHDLDEAFLLGDRVALLSEGRLVQIGTRNEYRDAPRSEQVRRFVEGHLHGR